MKSKAGEKICGDVWQEMATDNGRFYVLADGMGCGQAAHDDARFASNLIFGFLTAGNSPEEALNRTGEILFAKSKGERPVAADLLFVGSDGLFRLYKAGGAPSLFRTAGNIKQLTAELPPLGAFPSPKTARYSGKLKENGGLLLRTDGLLISPDSEWASLFTKEAEDAEPFYKPAEDDATALWIRLLPAEKYRNACNFQNSCYNVPNETQ